MTITTGRETAGVAYFCPKCSNPVEIQSSLQGAPIPVQCGGCGWRGVHLELHAAPFKHEFRDDNEIADLMGKDLRTMLAQTAAQTYGRFLLKWGFLDQPIMPAQLGRYMTAIAKAVVTTVVETRKQMTEEKSREHTSR